MRRLCSARRCIAVCRRARRLPVHVSLGVRGAISHCVPRALRAAADDRSSARCGLRDRVLRPDAVRAGLRHEPALPRGLDRRGQDDRDRRLLRIADDPERPGTRSTRPTGCRHRRRSTSSRQPERSRRSTRVIPTSPAGAIETSLDVEYSHAMAPGANILLVETPVAETEGRHRFPADRRGRELRDQSPPRRRHQPELRRDRGDIPERPARSSA